MPLHRASIRNFQAHAKKEITFQKVTTFTGPTEVGKSALIRFLRWVLLNKPNGTHFISHGKTWMRGEIEIDGRTIVRRRGKKGNLYYLDGEKLAAPGTKVPEPIKQLLNLDEDNFQRQFDPHFWLALSPSDLSKELNRIVNLQQIDKALSNIAAKEREARAEEKVVTARVQSLTEQSKELAYVADLDEDLKRLETIRQQIDANALACRTVSQIIEDGRIHSERAQNAARARLDAGNVLQIAERVNKKRCSRDSLRELLEDADRFAYFASADVPDVSHLETMISMGMDLADDADRLRELVKRATSEEAKLCQAKAQLKSGLKELRRATGKRCPLCGGKWSASSSPTSTCQTHRPSPAAKK